MRSTATYVEQLIALQTLTVVTCCAPLECAFRNIPTCNCETAGAARRRQRVAMMVLIDDGISRWSSVDFQLVKLDFDPDTRAVKGGLDQDIDPVQRTKGSATKPLIIPRHAPAWRRKSK